MIDCNEAAGIINLRPKPYQINNLIMNYNIAKWLMYEVPALLQHSVLELSQEQLLQGVVTFP